MADFQTSSRSPDRSGKPRSSRTSTRIDFTPMVDLGFLLITFFMLTTVLSKPQVMALAMPDDSGDSDPLSESKALTLLLGANDRIYWYEGMDETLLDSTGYSPDGLRRVILDKMEKVNRKWGLQSYEDLKTGEQQLGSYLSVVIKPGKDSRYRNLVDALDEMAICHVRYYCIMDFNEGELAVLTPE